MQPQEKFTSCHSTMKVIVCFFVLFAVASAVDISCPDEGKIFTAWNHRYCLAQVYHGNMSDTRSTLPAKYLAIYDDSVPRTVLADQRVFHQWILGDCKTRSRKLTEVKSKHFKDETSFIKEIKFNSCVHSKKLDDDMRRRKDTACINSRSLFHRTSELFIDCYRSKSYATVNDICWSQILSQGQSAERYVNWACSSQDNFESVDDCLDDLIMEADTGSSCARALKMRKALIQRSENPVSPTISYNTQPEKGRNCDQYLRAHDPRSMNEYLHCVYLVSNGRF